ncbi:universal stress protein [Streptomyces sp. NPDC001984]|uniref:universal stress protein n=1 Tax=Streptomyces sp. NPDC002619 TaxID=3364655 RepID=UPI0036C4FCBD
MPGPVRPCGPGGRREHGGHGPGRLGRTLTDVSAHAQLVVVAARGRRGLPRLPWDGTSRFLLRDAGCPVAVVPSNGHGG